MLYFFIAFFSLFYSSVQALCPASCYSQKACTSLPFFIKNQNKCTSCALSKTKCGTFFCHAFPIFCKNQKPISGLTLNSMTPETDVCLMPLIHTQTFKAFQGSASNTITLHNLNNVDIRFFSDTKGPTPQITHQRNLGTLFSLVGAYLCLVTPQNQEKTPQALRAYAESWVRRTFDVDLQNLNFFQFHMIVDSIRVKIFTRLHIPFRSNSFLHEGYKYTHHISAIGCLSEQS